MALPTLEKVYAWGKTNSPSCTRCADGLVETIQHWFFYCSRNNDARSLLQAIIKLIHPTLSVSIPKVAILGLTSSGLTKNTDLGDQILDIYIEVMYFNRMKAVTEGSAENPIVAFGAKCMSLLSHKKKVLKNNLIYSAR